MRSSTGSRSRGMPTRLALEVSMDHGRREARLRREAPQFLRHDHRAMTPPRAPDGDGEVGLALALVPREQEFQEGLEPRQKSGGVLLLDDEIAHAPVSSIQGAKLLDEMRVGQEAHVEDEIGVHRQTVLEPE